MRRLLAILAVIALIVAGCDLDGETTETTAPPGTGDTVAPDQTTTTESEDDDSAVSIDEICKENAAQYPPEGACANFADAETTESPEEETAGVQATDDIAVLHHLDHICLVVPNFVFVIPDDRFNAAEAGLTAVGEDTDFETLGVLNPDEFLNFLAATPLGLFQTAQGADLAEVIADAETQGVAASPHYLFVPTDPKWKYGPHTIALPIPGAFSDLATNGPNSTERRLVVVDTGAAGDTATVRVNVTGARDYSQEGEAPLIDDRARGHGLFAASVARQFSPSLTIDLYRASGPGDLMTEASVIDALLRADLSDTEVVSLSLGTYPCLPGDPTLGLIQTIWDLGLPVIAASGNDGKGHPPMYPAALGFDNAWTPELKAQNEAPLGDAGISLSDLKSTVTAVGAMDLSGAEAPFSNTSEVLAPGVDLAGWYYDPSGPPVWNGETSGLAVWSGTSFAAPHFAACVASGACTPP